MRNTLILINCMIFSACSAPYEACLTSANQNLLAVQSLISQSEATIARGYGVKESEINLLVTEPCFDGTDRWCERSTPTVSDEAFAVDLKAERRKLRILRVTETRLRTRAEDAARQCAVNHNNG